MVELVRQNLKENRKIYKDIVKLLREKINKNVKIDHVGSTAIPKPNMYGKNIIDILVGAKDSKELEELINIVSSNNDSGVAETIKKVYDMKN